MSKRVAVDEMRSRPNGMLVALCVLLTGCSFFGKQVAISAANSCIQKQCGSEQGNARQQCMTSCQREYGP